MVFYRFNHLSQTLKSTSAGVFSVSVAKTAAGAPKYVYKPFLMAPTATAETTVAHQSSGHGHHDPGHYVSKQFDGWENWKSWKDVPDDRIPKSSWRDPDNPIYSHPRYIKYRKQCLFVQRPCGLPIYLREGRNDYIRYYGIVTVIIVLCILQCYDYYDLIYKKYYPDSNLFYFF